MARTVKDPDVRRNEILDVAQQLFLTKGYDNTSVQDILDGVGIAKGTFYHYFDSKIALLDNLIDRIINETMKGWETHIIDNQKLCALEKLDQYFDTAMEWKTERREFFMDIVRVIYRDENAIYRHKMMQASLRYVAPILARIIEQGVSEGVFHTGYPQETAEIIFVLLRSMSESIAYVLLDAEYTGDLSSHFDRLVLSHQVAIARVLGYDGTLQLIDLNTMRLWAELAETNR